MKERSRVLLSGLLVLLFQIACVHTGFTPTSNLRPTPRNKACYVDVILDGKPSKPHKIIGRISTASTAPGLFALGEDEQVALERMKREACLAGAHFIYGLNTGSQGSWSNDGYSRSTRGAAIAGVYINAKDGSILPPPSGPQKFVPSPKATHKVNAIEKETPEVKAPQTVAPETQVEEKETPPVDAKK